MADQFMELCGMMYEGEDITKCMERTFEQRTQRHQKYQGAEQASDRYEVQQHFQARKHQISSKHWGKKGRIREW